MTTSCREECGVFGVTGVTDAANFVALGLHALQHRGQEAGGIVSYDPESGLQLGPPLRLCARQLHQAVADGNPAGQPGHRPCALFHRRAKGQTQIRDVQPFFGEFSMGGAAIAHNGNITNAEALRAN